jgi:hypothetical protein
VKVRLISARVMVFECKKCKGKALFEASDQERGVLNDVEDRDHFIALVAGGGTKTAVIGRKRSSSRS